MNKQDGIAVVVSMFKACGVHTTLVIHEKDKNGVVRPTGETIKV